MVGVGIGSSSGGGVGGGGGGVGIGAQRSSKATPHFHGACGTPHLLSSTQCPINPSALAGD